MFRFYSRGWFDNGWPHLRHHRTADCCLQPMGGEDITGEQSQASDWSRGDWRLARVTEVYPDRRGVVRNIEDCMKPKHDGTPTK